MPPAGAHFRARRDPSCGRRGNDACEPVTRRARCAPHRRAPPAASAAAISRSYRRDSVVIVAEPLRGLRHRLDMPLLLPGRGVCVEIDARARGWFYSVGRRSGANVEHVGEYLEVWRPHRLVLALLAEKYSLNFELVTVVFNPRGTGCELSLIDETKAEFVQQVRCDWIKLLDRLAAMRLEGLRAEGTIWRSRSAFMPGSSACQGRAQHMFLCGVVSRA